MVLAVVAVTLLLGPRSYPSVGVAAAQILSGIDAVFSQRAADARGSAGLRCGRWWAPRISVVLGLLVLPRSTKAPSNFERATIATAELSRVVVIVLAVAVSFFDFITAPKPFR